MGCCSSPRTTVGGVALLHLVSSLGCIGLCSYLLTLEGDSLEHVATESWSLLTTLHLPVVIDADGNVVKASSTSMSSRLPSADNDAMTGVSEGLADNESSVVLGGISGRSGSAAGVIIVSTEDDYREQSDGANFTDVNSIVTSSYVDYDNDSTVIDIPNIISINESITNGPNISGNGLHINASLQTIDSPIESNRENISVPETFTVVSESIINLSSPNEESVYNSTETSSTTVGITDSATSGSIDDSVTTFSEDRNVSILETGKPFVNESTQHLTSEVRASNLTEVLPNLIEDSLASIVETEESVSTTVAPTTTTSAPTTTTAAQKTTTAAQTTITAAQTTTTAAPTTTTTTTMAATHVTENILQLEGLLAITPDDVVVYSNDTSNDTSESILNETLDGVDYTTNFDSSVLYVDVPSYTTSQIDDPETLGTETTTHTVSMSPDEIEGENNIVRRAFHTSPSASYVLGPFERTTDPQLDASEATTQASEVSSQSSEDRTQSSWTNSPASETTTQLSETTTQLGEATTQLGEATTQLSEATTLMDELCDYIGSLGSGAAEATSPVSGVKESSSTTTSAQDSIDENRTPTPSTVVSTQGSGGLLSVMTSSAASTVYDAITTDPSVSAAVTELPLDTLVGRQSDASSPSAGNTELPETLPSALALLDDDERYSHQSLDNTTATDNNATYWNVTSAPSVTSSVLMTSIFSGSMTDDDDTEMSDLYLQLKLSLVVLLLLIYCLYCAISALLLLLAALLRNNALMVPWLVVQWVSVLAAVVGVGILTWRLVLAEVFLWCWWLVVLCVAGVVVLVLCLVLVTEAYSTQLENDNLDDDLPNSYEMSYMDKRHR